MADQDEQTVDYFDLIVECAKAEIGRRAEGQPIGSMWVDMFTKDYYAAFNLMNEEWNREYFEERVPEWTALSSALGGLAKTVLMMAWYYGCQGEDCEDNPLILARQMAMAIAAQHE